VNGGLHYLEKMRLSAGDDCPSLVGVRSRYPCGQLRRHVTQRRLAERAGISTQTVADYERRARTPHPNNLRAMMEALERFGIEFISDRGVIVGVKKR
jgi:hypothetical protein